MEKYAIGTSNSTNPIAMQTIFKDSIFTNVAMTSDGGVFWEGLENEIPSDVKITDWLGKEWKKDSGSFAAHPNSRLADSIGVIALPPSMKFILSRMFRLDFAHRPSCALF